MANKNEAKIKFTADCTQFNKSIQDASSEMSELRAELRYVETQMLTNGKSADLLEEKQKILAKQYDASQSKIDALNNKIEVATKYFGANSTEVSKLRTQLANARTAQEKVTQAINSCNNELEEQEENTKEVSEGFTVMKGAMAELVAEGITKVTEGLASIGTESFNMANDIDSATNTFIAKTGESKESAAEFEEVMADIYNGNYGESFEDISDAMATIKTVLGDIGTDEFEKLTTKSIVLRDTFDMDVNESIRAANSLMKQFGIDGDSAYNLIAQGAQKGLNQNGDLLDVINEYSVQFKNAGYDADEMFNMLANGAAEGTWSVDKLGDAVKEFNIRASDGTVGDAIKENAKAFGLSKQEAEALANQVKGGSVEAYNELLGKLKQVDDDSQRYQLGVAMFGTMWEDLGEEAVMALMKTQGEIKTTEDTLKDIDAIKYDDIGSAIEGIKRNLQTSIAEPMKEEVMPVVNDFIEDTDWKSVGKTIGNAFAGVAKGAVAIANGIKSAVSWMNQYKGVVIAVASVIGILATAITAYNVVQGVKTAMDAANVTTVWALVAAHWAQATAAMAAIAPYILVVAAIAAVIAIIVLCIKYWDEIVAVVKRVWENIKSVLSQWGEWINTNVIQPVVAFFQSLWGKIQEIWNGICNVVQVAIMFIGSIFSAAFDVITLPFQFIWENCKEYVFQAWEWIKEKVSTAINAIKNTISNVWNAIKTLLTPILNGIKNVISNAWNAVKTTTSNIFNGVKSVASSVWNSIKSTVSSIAEGVKSKISSVWNGIKSTTSSVFNGVKSTASSVWNAIKTAITKPIESAKEKIKSIVDAIKGFFSGMKLEFPKIKMPSFKIKGKFSLDPPSVPKLSITWNKDGAIFQRPTIFDTRLGLQGVGEAGPEAILPIEKLEDYVANAVEKTQQRYNFNALANAIEHLASRAVEVKVGDMTIATATASANDRVNGLRTAFIDRGLVLD